MKLKHIQRESNAKIRNSEAISEATFEVATIADTEPAFKEVSVDTQLKAKEQAYNALGSHKSSLEEIYAWESTSRFYTRFWRRIALAGAVSTAIAVVVGCTFTIIAAVGRVSEIKKEEHDSFQLEIPLSFAQISEACETSGQTFFGCRNSDTWFVCNSGIFFVLGCGGQISDDCPCPSDNLFDLDVSPNCQDVDDSECESFNLNLLD